ncbi:MAG: hypothetical protein K2M93_01485, partial [Muribaculaceae bacterium]|nr:hypothetical protein [Muribaculaceae bacterium]
ASRHKQAGKGQFSHKLLVHRFKIAKLNNLDLKKIILIFYIDYKNLRSGQFCSIALFNTQIYKNFSNPPNLQPIEFPR